MADIIARFKGDTSDLDTKIKKASQTLVQMERDCRKVGGAFINLEKNEVDFIKSLGQMETGAKSAKGTIAELSKAFTDMSAVYNRLTEEEKRDEGGKALRASLDQLKERIKDGKEELNKIGGEIGNNGSLLDQLSGKFGVNIKQLGTWGAALGAGKVALDVMKDAFFASEANLDEWNRAVYAGESAWDAFLTSINTGDISGFLSNIDSIISAAREAYNELDRLSTQKAINNPAIKSQEAENERFRAMLRTGRYIAPNDGRKGSMKEGQVLTDEQKKRIANMLESGMQRLNGYVRSEIDQTTKSIDALYREQAKRLGMSLSQFRAGTADMGAFDERITGYNNYKQWEAGRTNALNRARTGNILPGDEQYMGANPYAQYKAWGVFKDDGELFGRINELISQRTGLQSQNYSNTANAYRAINRATGGGRSGSSSGGGNGTTEAPLELNFTPKFMTQDEESKYLASVLTRNEMPNITLGLQLAEGAELKDLVGSMGFEDLGNDFKVMNEANVKRAEERTKRMAEEAEKMRQSWQNAAGAVSSVGQALSQIQNPIAKVAGIIAEAVANIALGFANSLKDGKMAGGPWGWIAAAAAGTGVMISTIAAIKSATAEYHAEGGIVGHGPFIPRGTDTTPAMLTPGEVVLSRAQTSNLASQLQGSGNGGYQGQPYVSGEKIFLGINAYLRRSGRGELVTSR